MMKSRKKIAMIAVLLSLTVIFLLGSVRVVASDNLDIYENMVGPYRDRVFGGEILFFYLFLMVVIDIGAYIATESVGAVFGVSMILSGIFTPLVPGVLAQSILLVITGVCFSLLVFVSYKR